MFTPDDFKKLNIPALTVTGWFDGDQPGAMFYWRNMRTYSPAKGQQYLIVGPWNHNQTFLGGTAKQGDLSFLRIRFTISKLCISHFSITF